VAALEEPALTRYARCGCRADHQTISSIDNVSRCSTTRLVDLLQGERVGRNDVRENGVVPAVDDSTDDHETG
jgi:hypothetical protein